MDVNEKIKELVEKNNVFLFMKGTPSVPQCGFSLAVANVLKHLNVKFESIDVLQNEEIRPKSGVCGALKQLAFASCTLKCKNGGSG